MFSKHIVWKRVAPTIIYVLYLLLFFNPTSFHPSLDEIAPTELDSYAGDSQVIDASPWKPDSTVHDASRPVARPLQSQLEETPPVKSDVLMVDESPENLPVPPKIACPAKSKEDRIAELKAKIKEIELMQSLESESVGLGGSGLSRIGGGVSLKPWAHV